MTPADFTVRVDGQASQVDAQAWNQLLAAQSHPTPFMRHEYLRGLQDSGSATPATGWVLQMVTLWAGGKLQAGCALYLKEHSYGEYVFDFAWANAHARHGLDYYPKAVVAVPFTPVPGARLLAVDAATRAALVKTLLTLCQDNGLSSLHLLFASDDDVAACVANGLMLRHTVQFHWTNIAPITAGSCAEMSHGGTALPLVGPAAVDLTPTPENVALSLPDSRGVPLPEGISRALERPRRGDKAVMSESRTTLVAAAAAGQFDSFDAFLASLNQEKRKKIRQERRKVADAGVRFRWMQGADISRDNWDFFYRCYERTYLEHGNSPYLTRDFFRAMAADGMAERWVLFIAERDNQPIASSLIAVSATNTAANGSFDEKNPRLTAYGRYWGALERVDCLHFEACFYQPLEWCIAHGIAVFEGGAQGEHKMARALMPTRTTSAHWLAHPSFSDAIGRFLEQEDAGMEGYLHALQERSPFKQS